MCYHAPMMKIDAKQNRRPIETAERAIGFIQGGNARVTFVSQKTNARFTFRVRAADSGDVFFVSLLNGKDNENNYVYIGYMRDGTFYHGGRKSHVTRDAASFCAFDYVWLALTRNAMPKDCAIWHEGACCRCGRALTVPQSIASGIGPECAAKRGIDGDFLAELLG